MKKIRISMVQYDGNGNPTDVVYGNYKFQDVAMFIESRYQEVPEELAKRVDLELTKN